MLRGRPQHMPKQDKGLLDQARSSIRVENMEAHLEERSRVGKLTAQDQALRRTFTEMLMTALKNPLVPDNVVDWTLEMVAESVAELEQVSRGEMVGRLRAILAQPEVGNATKEMIDASYGQTFDHLVSVIHELEGEPETLEQVKEQARILRSVAKREYIAEEWTDARVDAWIVAQKERLHSEERQWEILGKSLREQDVRELQGALRVPRAVDMLTKLEDIEPVLAKLLEDGRVPEGTMNAWHLLAAKRVREVLMRQMDDADTTITSIADIQRAMSKEQNAWRALSEGERKARKAVYDKTVGSLKKELKRLEETKKGAEQFFKVPSHEIRDRIIPLVTAYEGEKKAKRVWNEFTDLLEQKKQGHDERVRGDYLERPPAYYDWGSMGKKRTFLGSPADRKKYGRLIT